MSTLRTGVTVEELKRAWTAIESGRFRTSASSPQGPTWQPRERVITVLGLGGQVGATTVSLAIAEAAAGDTLTARVIEVGTPFLSGLTAAANAELGEDEYGWRHGMREAVRLERSHSLGHPSSCPTPSTSNCELTVVDAGWSSAVIHQQSCWLSENLHRSELVIVAPLTVPGMRALELALVELDSPKPIWVVFIGPPKRKWPKRVQLAAPPALDWLAAAGHLICVPSDRALAIEGITTAPLPPAVIAACRPITNRTTDISPAPKGNHDVTIA